MHEQQTVTSAAPPDATFLRSSLGLQYAIIGFYDIPAYGTSTKVIEKRGCLFSCFQEWQKGSMVHISRIRPGCPGSAYWLCGAPAMSHEDFLDFLVATEGLKQDHAAMQQFLDAHHSYRMQHRHLLIGPLLAADFRYCKTVTIFCNPDQMSALMVGLFYVHKTGTPYFLISGIGPGCYQLSGLFPSFEDDYAVVSSTDIAMRRHIPENLLSLTLTPSLYKKFCALDSSSFLGKQFWKKLVKSRENQPAPGA
jgi:hypothetical protein